MRSVLISWQIKVMLQDCRVVFTATFLSRMVNNATGSMPFPCKRIWPGSTAGTWSTSRWALGWSPPPPAALTSVPRLRQCRASGWPGRPAPWAARGRAGRHGCCTWRWCHWCRSRADGKSKTAEERTRVNDRAALSLKPLLHAMTGLFENTSENQYNLNRERFL